MITDLSDVSRTNQLQTIQSHNEIAEKLYLHLFNIGKGIECFSANNLNLNKYDDTSLSFYQKRHRAIKQEIKKRLADSGKEWNASDIQYFLSYFEGKNYVFFLSPNKIHSGWKQLFCKDRSNRERILNLLFKVYLLSEGLPIDTINGFEELLLIHSMSVTKSKKGLVVWGQDVLLKYNFFDVLTLTLSRKRLLFLPECQYSTVDGDEMGEILVYKKKNYYYSDKLDARSKNSIKFMRFNKDDEDFGNFKKTQLYHYQNLMTKLENFFDACGITYKRLNFQTTHYFENSFIKNIESVNTLEIINNSGNDLSEDDKIFLTNFFANQGVSTVSFYHSGKTISAYERLDDEERPSWKITEIAHWEDISLDAEKNYLVFNKILDEDTDSSMAYQCNGIWYPKKDIHDKPNVDFYSQLKRKTNYLNAGRFFSLQGVNMPGFVGVRDEKDTVFSVLTYGRKKNFWTESQETRNNIIEIGQRAIMEHVLAGSDDKQLNELGKKHHLHIKVSPEIQKILIELGIKNWIRKSLANPDTALPIILQTFSEQRLFAIYVRKPRKQKAKAVAVEFLYEEGFIYIKCVLCDLRQIEKRFPVLRRWKSDPEKLKDGQQYFVDERREICISCYTDNFFTPTLIGHESIIERLENNTLEINRRKDNKLLPHVLYYNEDVGGVQMKNLICVDQRNESFIQYYVPPAKSLDPHITKGFRVYHMIGKTFAGKPLSTEELIQHPLALLHFYTLTQNILKISDNSQSSLLQKVAKVFIEN
ncbi:MAG: hypothetical protein GY795_10730 [Desulfobacterales bacterium]|nr:hypothetical protein [Desulfobacterales bacterium]